VVAVVAVAVARFGLERRSRVYSRTSGMLVARTEKRSLVLPSSRLFHWAKRRFEWMYLRQYR